MKVGVEFCATGVYVYLGNGREVNVKVEEADIDEIIESIGLSSLLEHLGTQELIAHLEGKGYKVDE